MTTDMIEIINGLPVRGRRSRASEVGRLLLLMLAIGALAAAIVLTIGLPR